MSLTRQEAKEIAELLNERTRRIRLKANEQLKRPRRCRGKPKLRIVATPEKKPLPGGFKAAAMIQFDAWMPTIAGDAVVVEIRLQALALFFIRWLQSKRTRADVGDDWMTRYQKPDFEDLYVRIVECNELRAIETGRLRLVRSNGRAVSGATA